MNVLTRKRRCPQCAERIQVEAVMCRYCHSDLTVHDEDLPDPTLVLDAEPSRRGGSPAEEPREEPDDLDDSSVDEEPDSPETVATPRTSRWFIALVAVGLAVSAVLGAVAYAAHEKASTIEERHAAREEVRGSISKPIEALLSYDYRTLDAGMAEVDERLTPGFRKEYRPTIEKVKARATKNKISQVAYVVGVSTVTYDVDRVKALVFVNTMSSEQGSKDRKLLQNRLLVTMVRAGDDWLIAGLTIPVA